MATPTVKPNLRKLFGELIYERMKTDERIWVITGDLGFGLWDRIQEEFPDRFLNTGASEQAMIGIAVGLAQSGKIPIVYSITPFLLYRPFETIRNYIHHEKIPVKLVGSGHGKDYHNEGFSHWASEDKQVMKIFSNIEARWPKEESEVKKVVKELLKKELPFYINLTK